MFRIAIIQRKNFINMNKDNILTNLLTNYFYYNSKVIQNKRGNNVKKRSFRVNKN